MQTIMHNSASVFLRGFAICLMAVIFSFVSVQADAGTTKYTGRHGKTTHKASKRGKARPQPDRYGHIVIDAQSGFVLSEKNADKKLYPASLSKLMTLYLTFEAIEAGRLTKYQRVPVSSSAQYQPPSKLGLEAGYTIRIEDLILALVTRSANDAAVVLADAVGGSEARFGKLMTAKAQQLGMRGSHFVNASGLHDPEQYSTPRDMAILAQAIMRDFPRYYRYFSTPSFTYAGVTSLNHNKLMATYPGMDGMKTGYVNASGYNLVASAVQDGKRLIGVVFGGTTASARNNAMKKLLDDGFDSVKQPRIASAIQHRLDMARAGMPRRSPAVRAAPVQLAQATTNTAATAGYRAPVTARTQTTREAPSFSPMGLTEEGDTQLQDNAQPDITGNRDPGFKPRPMNTGTIATAPMPRKSPAPQVKAPRQLAMATPAAPAAPVVTLQQPQAAAGWTVQIGAFSNQDAGMIALKAAHDRLPRHISTNSKYIIVPLQTNRGTIYRARLSGMSEAQAHSACDTLKGNCLVMAAE